MSDEAKQSRTVKARQWLFWAGVAAIAVAIFAARPTLAWWARRSASEHLQAGRLGAAERWLARARHLEPGDVATQVLTARCYRHRDQYDRWRHELDKAAKMEPESELLEIEQQMGALRWNAAEPVDESQWPQLVEAGAASDEAAFAVSYGLLARGEHERFQQFMKQWEQQLGHPQQAAFMYGLQAQTKQQWKEAAAAFQAALKLEPDHEMAHAVLAQLSENQGDDRLAAEHFAYWAQHQPENEQAVSGWSRVLRRLNRAAEAKQALSLLAPSPGDSVPLMLEWAKVEYQLGNYDEAVRWFMRSDLEGPHESETLRTAAAAFALHGDTLTAHAVSDYASRIAAWQGRSEVLRKRVESDITDRAAARELQELNSKVIRLQWPEDDSSPEPVSHLFSQQCASCHGASGAANGPGARHLYPPPRDLRRDPYRLVSSENRFPRLEDIEAVIQEGIPGTAMPSFPELSLQQRKQLAEEVRQLRLEGLHDQRIETLRLAGREADRGSVDDWVREQAATAHPLAVPQMPSEVGEERLEEGRQLYLRIGCAQCHGEDGRGRANVPLFNEDGTHALPRDLVSEPMKGGASPQALYARLRLGMPGTPHPATPVLENEQLQSLVFYVRSLAESAQQVLTNQQRKERANRRAIEARVGANNVSADPAERGD